MATRISGLVKRSFSDLICTLAGTTCAGNGCMYRKTGRKFLVLKRDIDLEFIQSELDELLRMAASINDGYGSATFLLERYGSAARQSKLHRAGTQFGQLWDAVYLCDYAAQPPFRRSVNRVLVRGESVHQLERVIHAGPIRSDRGRRRDEKIMISGTLTLLTNAVIAYNTWKTESDARAT
jgi:TnpA family transposase